jgi:hypothetical protein
VGALRLQGFCKLFWIKKTTDCHPIVIAILCKQGRAVKEINAHVTRHILLNSKVIFTAEWQNTCGKFTRCVRGRTRDEGVENWRRRVNVDGHVLGSLLLYLAVVTVTVFHVASVDHMS